MRYETGEMMNHRWNREKTCHLWGWILFLICAGFFMASSLKNGDVLGFAGGVVFLVACVVFIIPLVAPERALEKEGRHERKIKWKQAPE